MRGLKLLPAPQRPSWGSPRPPRPNRRPQPGCSLGAQGSSGPTLTQPQAGGPLSPLPNHVWTFPFTSNSLLHFLLFFFFLFWLCSQHMKFPSQGWNPSCSCNLCHSCSNPVSLTHHTGPGIGPHCRRNNGRSLTRFTTVGTPSTFSFKAQHPCHLFWEAFLGGPLER